jgi:hypothetical protein
MKQEKLDLKFKKCKKIIKNILEDFNFEKVHKAMTSLDWAWLTYQRVPTEKEIKKCAENLLEDALKQSYENKGKGFYCATGGLKAFVKVKSSFVELEFVISCSSF